MTAADLNNTARDLAKKYRGLLSSAHKQIGTRAYKHARTLASFGNLDAAAQYLRESAYHLPYAEAKSEARHERASQKYFAMYGEVAR